MPARDKLIAPLFVLTLMLSGVAVWKLAGGQLDSQHVRWQLGQRFANALSDPVGWSLPSILYALVALAAIGGLIVCLRFMRDDAILRLKRSLADLQTTHDEALQKWQREAARANKERAMAQASMQELQRSLDESERLLTEARDPERSPGRLPAAELAASLDGDPASTEPRWTTLQELREGEARRLRERDDEVQSLRQEIVRLQEQSGAAMTAQQEERRALEQRWQEQVASLQARIDEQSFISETRESERVAIATKLADYARVERELGQAKTSLAELTEEKAARDRGAEMPAGLAEEDVRRELQQLRAGMRATEEALRKKDAELIELKRQRSDLPRAGGSGNQLLQAELVQKNRLLEAKDKALRELEERMKAEIGAPSESDTGKQKRRRKAKR